ncbi:RluA family pseudouridine synthase [Desulfogranum japonicum]|uniref:RluA family pseudouridine synthase n=1 Tax=Desulfogranum japonicum TaxID=231447 RepID=UPI00040B827D|nr:RluA family pseudouridine synthase [Desulfogranum japonicum]
MLDIVWQDPEFVVVNKPGGLLAVPGRGADKQDCVTRRVQKLFPQCIEQPAVHRLDMATSGLMVVALTRQAHKELNRQFSQRMVIKRYVALLDGILAKPEGTITLAFRLDPENRPYQVFDPVQGKTGITHYRVIAQQNAQTRVEFFPQTGRTHQLRLHSSHVLGLGCPIVGDALYGTGRNGDSMLLHAAGLQFCHPCTQDTLCFISSPAF